MLYFIDFSVLFIVFLFIGFLKLWLLMNIRLYFLLIFLMVFRSFKVWWFNGMRCGVFIFEFWWECLISGNGLCFSGIVYIVFIKLIFDYFVNWSLLEWIKMSNVSFIVNLVSFLFLKFLMCFKSFENLLNGNVGLWVCFVIVIVLDIFCVGL